MVASKAPSIEINNNTVKPLSNANRMASKMIRRKQSATWRDRYLTIQLLSKQTIQITIQPKAKYGEILTEVCAQLGLTELSIFGLAVRSDIGEYKFLDSTNKVCKKLLANDQAKSSSSANTASVDEHKIYLRVQHYVETGHSFRTEVDRKYYFQQLKENFLRYGFNYPDDRCFLLASYAIHADELNWRDFDPREYFPGWVLKRYGTQFVRRHMPTITPERLNSHQAMNTYIMELCTRSPYAYNMRLHRLQSQKTNGANDTRLGIAPSGLEVYEVNAEGYLSFLTGCQWRDVKAVTANKRRLDILTKGPCGNLVFYTANELQSADLAHTIRCSLLHFSDEKDVCSVYSSQDDMSTYRELYIYSDEYELEYEYEQSVLGTLPFSGGRHGKSKLTGLSEGDESIHGRNRFSITSSSTTTSGIVSDRTCLSMDNSREDLLNDSIIGIQELSCDSLLDDISVAGESYDMGKGRTVTVQRAISEPSKKFEQLRLQVTRQQPQGQPRRAVSDETVDDHDYENVSVIRKVLAAQMANRRAQSSSSQASNTSLLSGQCSPVPSYHIQHQAGPPRKLSMSSVTKLHVPQTSGASSGHRYSLISSSPSMERLLSEYQPPPSYNESHARQREVIMAGASASSSQASLLSTSLPASSFTRATHSASNSLTTDNNANQPIKKRQSSAPHCSEKDESGNAQVQTVTLAKNGSGCICKKLSSHPEIDQLRSEDLLSLPMISALCNDKDLQKTSATVCNCKHADSSSPSSPRPVSWHCDAPSTVFSFPMASAVLSQ